MMRMRWNDRSSLRLSLSTHWRLQCVTFQHFPGHSHSPWFELTPPQHPLLVGLTRNTSTVIYVMILVGNTMIELKRFVMYEPYVGGVDVVLVHWKSRQSCVP